MSLDRVKAYFAKLGIEERIIVASESTATVALAAKALHTEECRIAKTLSFHVGERVVLVVMAGDARIDNKKYKAYFGTKAKMLTAEDHAFIVVNDRRDCRMVFTPVICQWLHITIGD